MGKAYQVEAFPSDDARVSFRRTRCYASERVRFMRDCGEARTNHLVPWLSRAFEPTARPVPTAQNLPHAARSLEALR